MIRKFAGFLVLLLVFYVARYALNMIMQFFRENLTPSQPAQAETPPASPQTGDLLKDPVCGTYVLASSAVTASIKGTLHHFCSTACRDKFTAA